MTHYIVFIPGIKGSSITVANDRLIWPPRCLNYLYSFIFSRFDRTLIDVETINRLKNCDAPATFHVIDRIDFCGGLISFDVHGKFLKTLRQMAEKETTATVKIVTFAYDWRKSMTDAAEKLAYYLENLCVSGDTFSLIGHSMGGLIARYYTECKLSARRENEKYSLRTVVCIATPHKGSLEALLYLTGHKTYPLTSRSDSVDILSTYDSLYELLPFESFIDENGMLENACSREKTPTTLKNVLNFFTLRSRPRRTSDERNETFIVRYEPPKRNEFESIVNNLKKKFPEWNFDVEKLRNAYETIIGLNCNNKPDGVKYVFVEARGHNTAQYVCGDKQILYLNGGGDGTVSPLLSIVFDNEALNKVPPNDNVHFKILKNSRLRRIIFDEIVYGFKNEDTNENDDDDDDYDYRHTIIGANRKITKTHDGIKISFYIFNRSFAIYVKSVTIIRFVNIAIDTETYKFVFKDSRAKEFTFRSEEPCRLGIVVECNDISFRYIVNQ